MKSNLKRYRQFAGYSQEELASKLNMKLGTYRTKEQGKTSFKDQEKLEVKSIINEKVKGVTIDDIFFDSKVHF